MRILRLNVEGFRSLRDVTWQPADLNVVIGPNGTGKSNLLRSLEMIAAAANGRLSKFVQSNGGMEPLSWDGRADHVAFQFEVARRAGKHRPDDPADYRLTMNRLGNSANYTIGEERLLGFPLPVRRGESPHVFLDRHGSTGLVLDDPDFKIVAPVDHLTEDESLLSLVGGPFAKNANVSAFQKYVASWVIYHDLNVNQGSAIRAPVISKIERRVASDGQNLVPVLHTLYTGDRDFKRDVNTAMQAAFGGDFEELVFPPAADQRVQLRVRWKSLSREQSAADLSDGTLRFLFLLAVLASPDLAPLIAIDEPETGLHPSMLPIIADYAHEASKKSQVVLTTHSPALLDAFKDVTPATTVATWDHGETQFKIVAGKLLQHWLKSYSLGKLYTSGELEQLAVASP